MVNYISSCDDLKSICMLFHTLSLTPSHSFLLMHDKDSILIIV